MARRPRVRPNDGESAAALRYRPESDPAPRLTARGRGEVAQRIVAIAREHGIPIRRDPELVDSLAVLEPGDLIPSELYHTVAEILAYLYRLHERRIR